MWIDVEITIYVRSFLIEKLRLNVGQIDSVELEYFKDIAQTANVVSRYDENLY